MPNWCANLCSAKVANMVREKSQNGSSPSFSKLCGASVLLSVIIRKGKDIILPGEIKAILSKVVEAEKTAQANVVRRREETAATRSMLNTAKVMEDNPVALRLKELEVLERIAEKIDRIQVNGSLDSILTDLIRMNP
jgi:regulator of protease activity HflC (stomatin/prohibitin superfamily)